MVLSRRPLTAALVVTLSALAFFGWGATAAQAADPPPSTTTAYGPSDPVVAGDSFTIMVIVDASGGSLPSGTVTLFEGDTQIGEPQTLTSPPVVNFTVQSGAAGEHQYRAVYSGDSEYTSSESDLTTVDVVPANRPVPTITIVPQQEPTSTFDSISLVATVSGPGATPTGLVDFTIDSFPFPSTQELADGTATFSQRGLGPGEHTVEVHYRGDQNWNVASADATFHVAEPAITLTDPSGTPVTSLAAGDSVVVHGTGFPANTPFTVELHSTPVTLASGTISGSGTFDQLVTIPADTAAGNHTIAVELGGTVFGEVNAAIAVTAPAAVDPAASVSSSSSLAATGTNPEPWALAALMLIVIGVTGIAWRRAHARR